MVQSAFNISEATYVQIKNMISGNFPGIQVPFSEKLCAAQTTVIGTGKQVLMHAFWETARVLYSGNYGTPGAKGEAARDIIGSAVTQTLENGDASGFQKLNLTNTDPLFPAINKLLDHLDSHGMTVGVPLYFEKEGLSLQRVKTPRGGAPTLAQ